MDGIIVINKPLGMSSHDVVNKIRKTFSTKKVGHSGTLDKEASGVLVLGINKGTKLLNYLNQDDKAYIFTISFGIETDTLDHVGKVVNEAPVSDLSALSEVLKDYVGPYQQTPPDFSSVKVNGKKLYQYALEGKEIPSVNPRDLTIYALKQLSPVNHVGQHFEVSLYVHGSKGLYVRKLALDIAQSLNTVAHTTKIHRVKAGQFTIDDAHDLNTVDTAQCISMSDALKDMPSYYPNNYGKTRISHGLRLSIESDATLIKCLDESNQLLAIYELKEPGLYKPKNVFM